MATWPTRGQQAPNYWDDQLRAYVDVGGAVEDLGTRTTPLVISEAGSYEFDITGALAVTVTALGDVTLFVHGTSQVLTVAGTDFTVDGDAVIVIVTSPRGAQIANMVGASGEPTPPEVVDPPTQPGAITVTPTDDGYTLSWIASTVAAGYEGSLDGGSYVDYGSDLSQVITGLSAGSSHSGTIRAYNSLGERSATRAWGPATVNTMALHDLILSMEPEVYVRLTEGSIQDYSRVPATWTPYNFYLPGASFVPTDFSGPALTPGDTGSLVPVTDTKVQRTVDGLMLGATAMTQFTVSGMLPGATSGGSGTGIYYANDWNFATGQTGAEGYQAHQPGGVHSWFSVWNPSGFGDNNIRRYLEGAASEHSIVGGVGAAPLPAPNYPNRLFMGGNENGGNSMGGYSAYTVIFTRALTLEERTALATSAGTINNPAGGTLT